MLVIGIVLIVLALGTRYWLGSRNFYRKNAYGVQEFSSYGRKVGTQYFERFMLFLVYFTFIIGLICIVVHFTYTEKFDNPRSNHTEKSSR